MSYFIRQGSRFLITQNSNVDIREKLPAATFTVRYNKVTDDYYLDETQEPKAPGKLYGNVDKVSDRVINTFNNRNSSTGIMLSGEKGSGKTLTARVISWKMQQLGHPTIIINENHCGDNFNNFMSNITQPAVILFDEFEKIYGYETQEKILTLFDGVYQSNKLFVVTCNDSYRVNEHMRNRPGRIYYAIDFYGLEADFIREYCQDNLTDQSHIDNIFKISQLYESFNFDMLQTIVEEVNRYGETPEEVIRMVNAKPFNDKSRPSYKVTVLIGDHPEPVRAYPDKLQVNPFDRAAISVYLEDATTLTPEQNELLQHFVAAELDDSSMGDLRAQEDKEGVELKFTTNDIHTISKDGEIVFARAGVRMVLVRERREDFNFSKFM